EHVLGRLGEIDQPVGERRRPDAEGHVLGVDRARGVVVAADAADPAGDEVGVTRVLTLHEDAVAAEDRRRAVALGNAAIAEVDPRVQAEAADHARDRVPGHLDELGRRAHSRSFRLRHSGSRSSEAMVKLRSARTARPYIRTAEDDILAPGGSSMKGMNLSGNPGIVQPMQTPPTFGQPPTPPMHPRFGTLHRASPPAPRSTRSCHSRPGPPAPGSPASRCTGASRSRARSRPARSNRPDRRPRAPSGRRATAAGGSRPAGSWAPGPPTAATDRGG